MTQALDKTIPNDNTPTAAGLRVPRRFTKPGVNPLDQVRWDKR